MAPDFVLPTTTLRVTCSSTLSAIKRHLIGALNFGSYYTACYVVDIPSYVLNIEIRETAISILAALKTPYLILRGATSNPYPDVHPDGQPVFETFRNRSRTVCLLLRSGSEPIAESSLNEAARKLQAVFPTSTIQPYTRVVRVAGHELDAMEVETIIDGRNPAATVIDEIAEDLLLYLARRYEDLPNAKNPLALESAIFDYWQQYVDSTGEAPFSDTWFVSNDRIHCATLAAFHRPNTMEMIEQCLILTPAGPPILQQPILDAVGFAEMAKDKEFIGLSLRHHDVLNALMDGDVLDPRMITSDLSVRSEDLVKGDAK